MAADPIPFVHDTGEGPPVVLLHAFPLDASMWDTQVAALSGRWRCLRPDAYGCGSSPPPPPGPLTLDRVAVGVLGALDALGVGEFALGGLSMGGYTAMAMLRAAPERVRALVLADTRPDPDTDAQRADRLRRADRVRAEGPEVLVEPMLERLLAPRNRDEPHIADPVRARIRRGTAGGLAACLEAMASRPDSTDVLRRVRVPALVIGGRHDEGSPPDVIRALAALMPGARVEVLEDAGHLSSCEVPLRFSALLRDFLAEAYAAP